MTALVATSLYKTVASRKVYVRETLRVFKHKTAADSNSQFWGCCLTKTLPSNWPNISSPDLLPTGWKAGGTHGKQKRHAWNCAQVQPKSQTYLNLKVSPSSVASPGVISKIPENGYGCPP